LTSPISSPCKREDFVEMDNSKKKPK